MNQFDELERLEAFMRRILRSYAGHKAGKIDRLTALKQIERIAIMLGYARARK